MSGAAARARGISRRHLIRSGAAATLLAASSVAAGAEPRRHGVLRLAAPGGWSDGEGLFGRLVAPGTVFDCLTEIGPDGRLHGELAEAWEPRGDARHWTMTLRDGVAFHDGRPFGAEDAVASLRMHVAAAPDGLGIASVRKAGPRQVAVTLRAPDPGFPFLLADPGLVMLPADDPAGARAHGIGTGLYRLEGGGERAVRFRRVASHFKDGHAGWFEAVELLGIADPAERTAALLSGRVDAVSAPDPRVLAQAGRTARPLTVSVRGGSHLRVAARGPDAPALAAALKAGLDRPTLLAAFLGGEGRLAADHPLSPDVVPVADPGRARHHLARAGVDRVTLAFGPGLAGMPGLDGLVRALREFADGAGVALAAAADAPDIVVSLAPAQPTDGLALRRFPATGLSDPDRFAARLLEARQARDSALRQEIEAELGRVLAREAWTGVPVFAHARFAHSARLTHLGHTGALDMFDSARIAERWFYGSYG